jgi:autotransporter-associated beta strand protein
LLLASTALIAVGYCDFGPGRGAYAADNTWQTGGVDNTNYNETTNWDTGTVPAAGGDAGVFGAAGSTTVVVNAPVAPDSWTFNAAALSFVITGSTVTFGGAGIVNNSLVNQSIANDIAGTGGLSQGGSAMLTLSGASTYTGTTTVTAGTLAASGSANRFSSSSAFDVNGTLDLGGFGQVIGSLTGSGTVTNGVASSGVLSTGGNNTSTSFSGVIQNGAGTTGLTKAGSGTMTLSNTSTYTGATTVNAGTLSVNGSISSSTLTTVNSGGTLGGTGTVGATTIVSGGTLAPGNSIGTISVSGNLTFNAGSNYDVEVSPSAADRTNVTGTAQLNGTVNATYAAGSYVAKQYTIVNATGGRTGTFSGLNNTSLPSNVGAALSYDANNAYLVLTLNYAVAAGNLNSNQQNVSNALENYFNTTGGIPGAFASLSANGLSQASGESGTGTQQSGFNATGQFMNAVFGNAFFGGAGDEAVQRPLGYAPARKVSRAAEQAYAAVTPKGRASISDRRWSVWAAGYGGTGSVDGDNAAGSNKITNRVYGAVAGAGYRATPDTQYGFALGGAGSSFAVDNGFGSGKADMFNAAVYARHSSGPAYVAAALGYTWQEASTDRTVTNSGTDVLHASFHPQALTSRLEGGRRIATPAVGITPYAALQSTTFFLPSYSETATSGSNQFALTYSSHNVTATRGELGANWDKGFAVQGGVFMLKAKTAWAHDWNTDRTATATFQQLPGATFTVDGAQPSADVALASLGAEITWRNGWSVAAKFDGEFSVRGQTYAGNGMLRYVW